MAIITINNTNIETEHICCAIGNDKENKARAQTKKAWMKTQFDNGLVFKRLDQRGKVFIEYMPIEHVWKPVKGYSYYFINCLWVSGQFQGKGYAAQLLSECISDAKEHGMNGVVVVTSSRKMPFLTDKSFYSKYGFTTVDTVSFDGKNFQFELMALKFNDTAENPHFHLNAKTGECDNKNGFTIIYSNQCVYMEEYASQLEAVATEMQYECKKIKLTTSQDAQQCSSPFGTLGIYYNGKFLTHEIMSAAKFKKLIQNIAENK